MIRKGDSSILELKNIVKRFGELTAVNDVSLDLERGKLVTFLGPSGCGKTTLLRVVSGFTIPDEGKVILDGVDITDLQPNARDTAMVFQNYALFPHMTVAANIGFGLKIMKKTKREVDDEVERLLTLVQMEGLGDRRPHELSGGQQQRVALARALSLRPKILLLDEPLSNLDSKLRVEARTFISKLHQRLGTTFIYVTHDQVEAMTMGERIAVLNAGRLMQIDTPTALYDHPDNVFVAGFIGSPSMNFFDNSKLIEQNGKMVVDTGYFQVEVPKERYELYRPHLGKRVVFGIRPENIAHPDFPSPGIVPSLVQANVDVVEEMGHEKIVYLEEGGKSFLARMDPRANVRVGQRTGALLNMAVMHLFDAETEQALQ